MVLAAQETNWIVILPVWSLRSSFVQSVLNNFLDSNILSCQETFFHWHRKEKFLFDARKCTAKNNVSKTFFLDAKICSLIPPKQYSCIRIFFNQRETYFTIWNILFLKQLNFRCKQFFSCIWKKICITEQEVINFCTNYFSAYKFFCTLE